VFNAIADLSFSARDSFGYRYQDIHRCHEIHKVHKCKVMLVCPSGRRIFMTDNRSAGKEISCFWGTRMFFAVFTTAC